MRPRGAEVVPNPPTPPIPINLHPSKRRARNTLNILPIRTIRGSRSSRSTPPPYQQAYPQPIPPGPVPGGAPAQPPRQRTGLIVLIIVLVVMLTAGGGTAAWWFLLRDSGSIIDPNMVVPADDWAAGAKQTGSSTIKKDATIAVSPNGSFLVALSKDSSGTGRSSSGATLTGYSLTGGRASESWSVKVEIASIMETYIVFWDNDTIVADDRLYDVATGDHRSAPWKGAAVIVNDLALGCESGSCSAWRQDGSRAWSVDATEEANVSEGVIVRSGKHYVVAVGEADRDRAHP